MVTIVVWTRPWPTVRATSAGTATAQERAVGQQGQPAGVGEQARRAGWSSPRSEPTTRYTRPPCTTTITAPTAVKTAAVEAIPRPRCRWPEEGEGGLEAAEGDQGAGTSPPACGATATHAAEPGATRAGARVGAGFGQPAGGDHGVDGRDSSRQEKGQPGSAEGGQRAQGRAGDEPHPEGRARAGRTGGPGPPGPARSAAAAWATETLAPDAPSMIRPTSSTARPPASPVIRLPTAVPASDTSRTGLRPNRSETRPHSGEHTRLAAEKAATSRVASKEVV